MIIDIDKTVDGDVIFIPSARFLNNEISFDLVKLLEDAGLDKNCEIVDNVCVVFYKETE